MNSDMILIIIELIMLLAAVVTYVKAVKTSKKIEELLNETEAYAYAKKRLNDKRAREKLDKIKRAELIRELNKEEDDGKPV